MNQASVIEVFYPRIYPVNETAIEFEAFSLFNFITLIYIFPLFAFINVARDFINFIDLFKQLTSGFIAFSLLFNYFIDFNSLLLFPLGFISFSGFLCW